MAVFPKNLWYMAAWSDEIGEALFARRLFDQPILFYRLSHGEVVALSDRCPHRFAPLSLGVRAGDGVQCPYHGLTFGADGACLRNPFADKIPRNARVRTWPVRERDGIVWLWAGDKARPDEDAIPDFSMLFNQNPPLTGYMAMNANYEFGTDNLMDLSHIEFVHKGSFAGNGVIFAGEHEIRDDGEILHSNWWMPNVNAPPHTHGVYPPDMKTDHWLDMSWRAPAIMQLAVGATPTTRHREEGIVNEQAHILTPETRTTTHYFWAASRPPGPVNDEADAFVRSILEQAFQDEDKPIIEAAFANLGGESFESQRPVSLGVDTGGVLARRKIRSLIENEMAGAE